MLLLPFLAPFLSLSLSFSCSQHIQLNEHIYRMPKWIIYYFKMMMTTTMRCRKRNERSCWWWWNQNISLSISVLKTSFRSEACVYLRDIVMLTLQQSTNFVVTMANSRQKHKLMILIWMGGNTKRSHCSHVATEKKNMVNWCNADNLTMWNFIREIGMSNTYPACKRKRVLLQLRSVMFSHHLDVTLVISVRKNNSFSFGNLKSICGISHAL